MGFLFINGGDITGFFDSSHTLLSFVILFHREKLKKHFMVVRIAAENENFIPSFSPEENFYYFIIYYRQSLLVTLVLICVYHLPHR